MKVNFQLVENYAINYEGRHIDIHNCFDFISYEYKVKDQTLILKWEKSSGDWVNADELVGFELIHNQVNYLSITPRDHEADNADDTCLGEITFFPSIERNINDSIIDQSLPHNKDDILYVFQGGQTIRVNCEEIKFINEQVIQ